MWNETVARLREFTDPTEFERLCADLLTRSGFPDVVPRGPAFQDSGADGESLFGRDSRLFQFSLEKTWDRKVMDTLAKIAVASELPKVGLLVFVTNQRAVPKKRDALRARARITHPEIRLLVLDIEWCQRRAKI
jgi:hypothetical protein